MKLQRSTGILLGVAISLVATVTLIETRKGTQGNKGDSLYDFAEADVSELSIEREDATLTFSNINDTWYMDKPESGPAEPSAISYLLSLLTSSTIKETITTDLESLEIYGLDEPQAIVRLMTIDETDYTIKVGNADFSDTDIYVITTEDSAETQSAKVHLIAKELENGLERPVKDWLMTNEEIDE